MIDWMQVSAGIMVGATLVGLAVWGIRAAMADTYVSHKAHDQLVQRVGTLEADVSTVKVGFAAMQATLTAVHESGMRTERMVDLLVRNELGQKAGELGAAT